MALTLTFRVLQIVFSPDPMAAVLAVAPGLSRPNTVLGGPQGPKPLATPRPQSTTPATAASASATPATTTAAEPTPTGVGGGAAAGAAAPALAFHMPRPGADLAHALGTVLGATELVLRCSIATALGAKAPPSADRSATPATPATVAPTPHSVAPTSIPLAMEAEAGETATPVPVGCFWATSQDTCGM